MKEIENRENPIAIDEDEFMIAYRNYIQEAYGNAMAGQVYIENALQEKAMGRKMRYYKDEKTGRHWYESGRRTTLGFNIPKHLQPE